ncbi:MAG: hypothetical protein AB7S26_21295 [Sandaracinaceae bacterium]
MRGWMGGAAAAASVVVVSVVVAGAFGLAVVGCETPDAERDGFVIVDQGARAAGIALDVDGERHEGSMPVAVPEGAGASILREGAWGTSEERIAVAPGELVEIVGAEGEVRRHAVQRDALFVAGEEPEVRAMADLIGARATRRADGSWSLDGPNAFVLAALVGAMPGVRAVTGPAAVAASPPDVVEVDLFLRGTAAPSSDADAEDDASDAALPDAAALVGVYHHGAITLILDAMGGYSLFDANDTVVRRGTFEPRPGGVRFVPEGGGAIARMDLSGDLLVDDLGVGYAP